MDDANNHINTFTATDIEKYHRGMLSPGERHAIEKAALDDPFLADALEGYSVPGVNVAADIATLKKKLAERTEEEPAKVIAMNTGSGGSFRWLRAAVAIIGIAGAGILTYQLAFNKKNDETDQVAKTQDPVKEKNNHGPTTAVADSNTSIATGAEKDKSAGPEDTTNSIARLTIGALKHQQSGFDDLSAPQTAVPDSPRAFYTVVTPERDLQKGLSGITVPKETKRDLAAENKADLSAGFNKRYDTAMPGWQRSAKFDDAESEYAKAKAPAKKSTIPSADDLARQKAESSDKKLKEEDPKTERIAYFNTTARPDGNAAYRTQQGAVSNTKMSNQDFFKLNNFRGQVLDNNNNPLPFANVTNVQDGIGTYADAKGFFNLTSTADSVLNVNVRVLGYNNLSNIQLRSSNTIDNKLQMQEDRSLFAQVVEKNKKANEERIARNTMKLAGEPEPEDGWDNYYSYLDNNANAPDEIMKGKENTSGVSVDISFEVNKYGEPVKFKVERSLCSKCNAEAIRLIKDGPKWKRKAKNGRITVTISF